MQQQFISTLKKSKYSATTERKIIFEILAQAHDPLTMHELVQKAEAKNINRSTVYRTTQLFEKLNIAVRVYTGWKYRVELSEDYSHHHHHFTCTNCGKVEAFDEPEKIILGLGEIVRYQLNGKMTAHSVELSGLCSKCY